MMTRTPSDRPDEDRASSDPLPYTQVDRSVKPTAALIAERLGVTYQHALGGLVQFWDLNGDPRELGTLIAAGREEVILTRDEVSRRFLLAMGREISPDELVALRLLEARDDGFRVRGMSRYFKPLARRLQAKHAAEAGGRASARSRTERFGSADPRSNVASRPASPPGSGSGSRSRRGGEATAEARTEAPLNTAYSGQRTAFEEQARAPVGGTTARTTRRAKHETDPAWRPLLDALGGAYREALGRPWEFVAGRDASALKALRASHTDADILVQWRKGLRLQGYAGVSNLGQLRSKWGDIDRATGAGPGPKGLQPRLEPACRTVEELLAEEEQRAAPARQGGRS